MSRFEFFETKDGGGYYFTLIDGDDALMFGATVDTEALAKTNSAIMVATRTHRLAYRTLGREDGGREVVFQNAEGVGLAISPRLNNDAEAEAHIHKVMKALGELEAQE